MSLPVPPNATCDVYHGTNAPPSTPDVAGVSCYLEERFRNIKPIGGSPGLIYDHILRVAWDLDIRDDYNGVTSSSKVYVPDQDGTEFQVVAVARVGRGTAVDHKIVYLQRGNAPWPTNDV
ncbi:MAG TPA: hypothetical protein VN688_03105 [Gemmataceae bacterium]|nr:hypothetical protein [Gemmataceae bacterium]